MRSWSLGVAILLALLVAGCSGNSTEVSVTITGPAPATTGLPVQLTGTVQLAATVSGISATTVFWQICLAPSLSTAQPTNCTPGQGPTQCTIPTVTSPLTGYGTITLNGLYTAPAKAPASNKAIVVATSCVRPLIFGTYDIVIDSGFRVTVTPATATIGTEQSFQFNATVTGPSQSTVTWAVCEASTTGGSLNCTVGNLGTITQGGLYTAPATASGAATIQATCTADPTQTATAVVTVVQSAPPTITAMDPTVAAAGSAQQDVYVTGTGFLNTEEVFVTVPPLQPVAAPTTFISTTLLRATIPAAQLTQAGTAQLSVQTPDGVLFASAPNLNIFATRPVVVASTPESVTQSTPGVSVALTGGFFSAASANATTTTFNGAPVLESMNSSRQMSISVPSAAIPVPGLYPILVQNAGVSPSASFMSGLNLGVKPPANSAALVSGSIAVGTTPSSVAVDTSHGIAVVANTGSNSVSLVNLATGAVVGSPIAVGNQPTGVAVDDLLPHPVALVVNSTDQTVTAIDLTTLNQVTLSVSISSATPPTLPYSVGINSMTPQPVPNVSPVVHRAIVAYQSSNQATVLDVSDNLSLAGGTPVVSVVQQIGSNQAVSFSTGLRPAVAVDPRLNWAVITPGGAGTINVVDLGRDAVSGTDVGRVPQVVGTLSITTTVQGIGINTETHGVLLSDPISGALTTFTPLDNTVTSVTNPCSTPPCVGAPFNVLGFGAAAANPLDDVAVAVNNGTAVIVDLENSLLLQTITGLGTSPTVQAVAVDPVGNQAIVANSGDGTVSILSMGPALNPMQILEESPFVTYTSTAPLTVTLTGTFPDSPTAPVARLDQTPLVTTPVAGTCTTTAPITCRQLTAVIPASMLGAARRFALDVQNPSTGGVSNIEDFTVIQAIPVGNAPVGVAVDSERDLAVVTNSGDGTASLVSLAAGSAESPDSLGPVGVVGAPVPVGSSPAGVAVLPRLHLALVANNASNDATVVDVTGVTSPTGVTLCGTNCSGPTGVAINGDTATGAITNTNTAGLFTSGSLSIVPLSPVAASATATATVDQDPVAVAIDPTLNYAAVATASQSSSIDIIDMSSEARVGGVSGASLGNPSGVVFDPVNQVFLAANSQLNNIAILDPATFIETPVNVGIAPTSLDYNFQASTLVTVNGPSHTMSVMAYVCPPATGGSANCLGPQVRTVLGLGGSQNSVLTLGPNAVAVDPRLNLAVLVDADNNQVLLVPLPH